jgi:ParB-like chromosome segregation protein Spo0J
MSNTAGKEFEYHEVAAIFPMLEGETFEALKRDIEVNGQHDPIWIYQGKIIDGRNRERACRELGIEPGIRDWDGRGDLVAFVVSQNLQRRHLTEPQRALVAARLKRPLA